MPNQLNVGEDLKPGASLVSGGGRFRLTYQYDNNVVLYRERDQRAGWSTGATGKPWGSFAMQGDGNVVQYGGGKAIWASNTRSPGATLVLQDDGNLVLYALDGRVVWSSNTYLDGETPPKPKDRGWFSSVVDAATAVVETAVKLNPVVLGVDLVARAVEVVTPEGTLLDRALDSREAALGTVLRAVVDYNPVTLGVTLPLRGAELATPDGTLVDRALDSANNATAATGQWVEEHPYAAIGVAIGTVATVGLASGGVAGAGAAAEASTGTGAATAGGAAATGGGVFSSIGSVGGTIAGAAGTLAGGIGAAERIAGAAGDLLNGADPGRPGSAIPTFAAPPAPVDPVRQAVALGAAALLLLVVLS